MQNTQISYKDIVEDVRNILIGYLSPLNLKFGIGQEQIYIDDVFMKHGAMPLFLCNKQDFLNQYVAKLNEHIAQPSEHYFAQIAIQRADPSYFGTSVEIRHNFFFTMGGADIDNGFEQEKKYQDFVMAIAHSILSEENFIFVPEQKKVILDSFWTEYDRFMKELVLKQLQAAANLNLNEEDK